MAAGRTDVSSIYSKTEQQKRELEDLLGSLAQQKSPPQGLSIATQQRLSALATQFASTVALFRQEVAGMSGNRALWDRRAANVQEDLNCIQRDVDRQLAPFYKAQKQEKDRKELFGDRERRTSSGGPDNEMTSLAKEHNSLQSSNSALDDVLGQSRAILGNLINQNSMLKTAQKKLLDAANALGVSNSLVGVIDRRHTADKWLVYGGMVLTLFVLFSLWYLLRW
eukprot:CAMPEP_0172708488 /NCGR_PEP_ID=MMETSP1074-20121228/51142_1 /TAXON_ID=2916 /ORGANISM="Ceratium fusus, Strain PA161109" /LENGTH=223 /DNA_ID=CAMNT_0013531471 /DNA_START=69 /DNA_END=740 /DNA_ORIENTATION=-